MEKMKLTEKIYLEISELAIKQAEKLREQGKHGNADYFYRCHDKATALVDFTIYLRKIVLPS